MSEPAVDLQQIVRGFREARVVLSAVELDILPELVEGFRSAADIARDQDLDLRATQILLDALTSLGVLTKQDETYRVHQSCRQAVDPGNPENILPALWHSVGLWRRWSGLTQVVRQGYPVAQAEEEKDWTKHFIGAMRVGARRRAAAVVSEVDLSGVTTLLDLGGGPGSYAIEFARRKSDLQAVVFDLVGVVEIAARHIAEEGLADRITTMAGNYLFDPIGGPYDLIWISSIVHMHTDEQNREIIRKAAHALNPGGRVVVREFLLNEDGAGPASAAMFAVNMLVGTEGGRSYRASEISRWMAEAGLKNIETLMFGEDGLVTGCKD